VGGGWYIQGQDIATSGEQQAVHLPYLRTALVDEQSRKNLRVERLAILAFQRDGAAQERGVQESGDALGTMVYKRVQPDLTPSLAIEQGNIVQGKKIPLGLIQATLEVEDDG
jgi:hypothetical protein